MPSPLPPQLFPLLTALVECRAGLHYRKEDADILASKVGTRAAELGFASLLDYYYHLRYDDPDGRELDALIASLVVHESYLFREVRALEHLVDLELAPRVAEAGRARVWSAACAAGEEPLTLAMLLDDRKLLDRVEIVATDVSERVIERARQGLLHPRALREPIHPLAARYTHRDAQGVTVDPRIRRAVRFGRANLLDEQAVSALGDFDAVLCRNVLIYFAEDTVRDVVERIARRLVPGGSLWVGVSESLLRFGTSLRVEERGGSFLYRKEAR